MIQSKTVIASFKSSENEIQEVCIKISLLDPLGRARINIPSRGTLCKHIACFDLETYLKFNEKVQKWTCPICSKQILVKDLLIDEFFADILRQVPEDIEEIELEASGQWKLVTSMSISPDKKKRGGWKKKKKNPIN